MFDSLEEQIRQDENKESSTKARVLRYLAIAAVSVFIFGCLVLVVQRIH